jgi:hypothetical protein
MCQADRGRGEVPFASEDHWDAVPAAGARRLTAEPRVVACQILESGGKGVLDLAPQITIELLVFRPLNFLDEAADGRFDVKHCRHEIREVVIGHDAFS